MRVSIPTETDERPRLLFFRWPRAGLPLFLTSHLTEQVRSLEQFFDVTVVDRDCDYDEECDRHRPDLALFESGVYVGERNITNTHAQSQVPKLGFLHADAFDAARATFLSDMDDWGIDTFFTTSVSMAEYTPEIADRLYVWPNAVDLDVFRDYGQPKAIPVLFTGSQAPHYPWRNSMARTLSAHFPTMTCPHYGWNAERGSERMSIGTSYARMINAAIFVPACGSITRDVVRKHLEVPAAGTCLIAEPTSSLEAFGFRDMENCVLATDLDVVEKLDSLMHDEATLGRITRAGTQLVTERHSLAQRTQIRDWLELSSQMTGNQCIVQDSPAGPLRLTQGDEPPRARLVTISGRDRLLLQDAWEHVRQGEFESANIAFRRCLNYFLIPEAVIGHVFVSLLVGDARTALVSVRRLLDICMSSQGASMPDPVQWALYVRVLLCVGAVEEAGDRARAFQHVRHPELDRIRRVLSNEEPDGRDTGTADPSTHEQRATVNPLPGWTEDAWDDLLARMLLACDQSLLAKRLSTEVPLGQSGSPMSPAPRAGVGSSPVAKHIRKVSRLACSAIDGHARDLLRPAKRWLFEDEWTRYVAGVVRCEQARFAAVIGASTFSRGERGFRQGLRGSPFLPEVTNLESLDLQGDDQLDLVYITRRGVQATCDWDSLTSASLVFLEGIETRAGHLLSSRLREELGFEVLAYDTESARTHAALRRTATGRAMDPASTSPSPLLEVVE